MVDGGFHRVSRLRSPAQRSALSGQRLSPPLIRSRTRHAQPPPKSHQHQSPRARGQSNEGQDSRERRVRPAEGVRRTSHLGRSFCMHSPPLALSIDERVSIIHAKLHTFSDTPYSKMCSSTLLMRSIGFPHWKSQLRSTEFLICVDM